jgi:hypothetical protein
MLKILVSYMLGPFGMILENWYIQNSLIINSVIVLYGLFLLVSHLNYKRILDSALQCSEMDNIKIHVGGNYENLWIKAIEKGSFFPFISGRQSLLPKIVSVDAILALTTKDKRWNQMIENEKNKKR